MRTAEWINLVFFSLARDWLPAALMPMVYWQAGRFSSTVNESFQKRLKRLDDRLLRRSCYVLVPLGLGVLYLNTFPSAHVTATLGASLVLLRFVPTVGLAFLLVSIGIALGAVLGRYHYRGRCSFRNSTRRCGIHLGAML